MTIPLNPRWLLVSVLLISLQFCRAQDEIQVPPTLTVALGSDASTDNKLWDLTGNYDVNITVVDHNGLSIPVLISFFLSQDANGRLTTSPGNVTGLIFNNDDNSSFAIFTAVSGRVTGSGGFGRARFTVRFAGNGSFGNVQNVTVRGSMTVDAEMDPSSGQLVSSRKTRFTARISSLNTVKGTADDLAASLPGGVDGTWNLTLNLAGLQRLTGNGIIGMPNNAFGLSLNGRFNDPLFRIQARGASNVPNARSGGNSRANIFLSSDFSTIQVNGRLLGQKVSLNMPTEPDTGTNTPPAE